ncbi:zinc ribbon domain-containing protein [Paenibacillus sepulcri]|uniref:Zinc ribbon domain-containing protein n=1 Tax=Paenibacillus sepulcri TaxID=359917 RepID=A0ABS7C2D4_9BACL|nr:zinc ribbon domain-containing protein [Paenibacillus sepulcri]
MSFFDKMKQGASDAARKAQQTVEITKLKSQISGKEKEKDKLFYLIGTAIHASHQEGNIAQSEEEVVSHCLKVDGLNQEIQFLEERIKNIRFEKTCPTCSIVVPLDTRFCPGCGTPFPEEPRPENTIGEIRVICNHCLTENDLSSKHCLSCGNKLSGGEPERLEEEPGY